MSENSEPAAVAVDALSDLPLAWLYRMSAFMTASSAARLRSTCKLLQKVVDATWEPDEPTPPHRRKVPLTFEQVQAQLPPHTPWKAKWLRAAEAIAARRAAGLPDREDVELQEYAAAAEQAMPSFLADLADAAKAAGIDLGPTAAASCSSSAPAGGPTGAPAQAPTGGTPPSKDSGETHQRLGMFDPETLKELVELEQQSQETGGLAGLMRDFWGPTVKSSSEEITFKDVQYWTPGRRFSPDDPHRKVNPAALRRSFSGSLSSDDPDELDHGTADTISDSADSDSEGRYSHKRQDGCQVFWKRVFGPALTRLTANQACNLLKGKPVLGFIDPMFSDLGEYSTASERMRQLVELDTTFTYGGLPMVWPPPSNSTEPEAQPGRGPEGWEGGGHGGESPYRGQYRTPLPLREKLAESLCHRYGLNKEPHRCWVSTGYSSMLVTTDSSCKEATADEVQQFVQSKVASDADKFDVYLSIDTRSGPLDLYVFLGPVEPRFTGRLKAVPKLPATVGAIGAQGTAAARAEVVAGA